MSSFSRYRMLAGTAAALVAAPHAVEAQATPTLRLIGVQTDDMTPVFSAMKAGLYRNAGIDLELVPTTSGAVAVDAVMAGTYEIGKGSAISILNAYLHGLPIRIIGNGPLWDEKTPFSMMIVATDSPAKDGAFFNGKTLGTAALRDLNQLSMCAWIDKSGGDSKTITWVEAPNSAAGVTPWGTPPLRRNDAARAAVECTRAGNGYRTRIRTRVQRHRRALQHGIVFRPGRLGREERQDDQDVSGRDVRGSPGDERQTRRHGSDDVRRDKNSTHRV